MPLKFANYPFLGSRKRKRLCLITTTLVCLLFIIYQFIMYYMVSTESPIKNPSVKALVRGTHFKENAFYKSIEGKFTCIKSGEVIAFDKVNDDYCDCADGTDEPGTSACPNGIFYCTNNKKYPKLIPSSKVNDGICDCCDGSEEYNNENLIRNFDRTLQANTRHFLVPCPNTC
ncbi:unnamed protein product [Ceutorhynchus assimilis]|uniref:Glucosidase II beta subunit N-terminal domain-containing protein n=1 Tax=Ceutorhynchus assimilis TaxID=467358 RepID=A0A9N9MY99_9CUCU|nr:unnamed protein product [Ceutorhynchus assimilis]